MTHLLRIAAPKSWPISRKIAAWAVSPSPGPHPRSRCIPLLHVLRDLLGLADYAREAKYILKQGYVLVDGRVRTSHKFPVGLFDVISIPKLGAHYRLSLDSGGKLKLQPIDQDQAKTKLCKVIRKSMVKGGRIQICLHDGKCLIADDSIKPKDSVLISIEGGNYKILEVYPYQLNAQALLIGGENIGTQGKIKQIKLVRSSAPNLVRVEIQPGKLIETIEDQLMVIPKPKGKPKRSAVSA